jgi:hypothetical protein
VKHESHVARKRRSENYENKPAPCWCPAVGKSYCIRGNRSGPSNRHQLPADGLVAGCSALRATRLESAVRRRPSASARLGCLGDSSQVRASGPPPESGPPWSHKAVPCPRRHSRRLPRHARSAAPPSGRRADWRWPRCAAAGPGEFRGSATTTRPKLGDARWHRPAAEVRMK